MMEALFEMRGLAPVGLWVLAEIAAKTTGYIASLLTLGGVIYLLIFPETSAPSRRRVAQIAATFAVVGLAVVGLRLAITAARMSGGGWVGALDPMLLGFAWESPLGRSSIFLLIGYACILGLLLPRRLGLPLAAIGAGAIALSYAFVGHSLGVPRSLLGVLVVAHVVAVAFWVGALFPLWHCARGGPAAGVLLHRFGRIAAWVVGSLVIIGVVYLWYLSDTPYALIGTAYGATMLLKLAAVSLLLGLAALNKLRLVPAVSEGRDGAPEALRRSIAFEAMLVLSILVLTATLTSVTTPPVNL